MTDTPRPPTRRLLLAGAAAGPLLIASSLVQALLRRGFDLARHPPSALALGSPGWVQRATFVAAGLLLVAGAAGVRRAEVGRWTPRLLAVLGATLAAAGLFSMDPAFGFPPGTPDGIGASVSWHARVHGVLFPVGFAALVGTAVVTARRYARAGRRAMAAVAGVAAVASLVLGMWPNLAARPDGRFLPMWAGVVVGYLWTALLQADLARDRRAAPDRGRRRGQPVTGRGTWTSLRRTAR